MNTRTKSALSLYMKAAGRREGNRLGYGEAAVILVPNKQKTF